MIKANELRLGNWVSITGTAIQLAGEKFLYILAEDGIITRCEGIPLTAEILEKAGFEDTYGGCYMKGRFVIDYSHTNKTFEMMANNRTILIEYVHELQNHYYMNTRQELEIKL